MGSVVWDPRFEKLGLACLDRNLQQRPFGFGMFGSEALAWHLRVGSEIVGNPNHYIKKPSNNKTSKCVLPYFGPY